MPTHTVEKPSRETVTTIRSDGSRAFVYPADARGRYATARRYSALALIAFYLALPWVKINGYPAAFLDIAERRFHLFGLTFAAQDMWLMFFVISGVGFALFFVTALLGRIWCGWACPHTVFLDHVYRQIERWIEGNSLERRALAAAKLTPAKLGRRVLKHGLYILVSAAIMHLFLAYFVSLPEVWSMIRASPAEHWAAFLFMAISTGILYFNFAWFREQLCIVLCPYGRLQSALIDDHTVVIGYDARRGEPRGKARRHEPAARGSEPLALDDSSSAVSRFVSDHAGDCVDCLRCVHVCPTGIDIRQGLQLECVGCTACIDACDEVMTRLRRPKGLIRYDSQAKFSGGATRWIRPRTILYFVLLIAGVAAATWAASTVKSATLGVTRITGAPYIVDAETVRNQFLVRIVNKRNSTAVYNVNLFGLPEGVEQVGFERPLELGPLQEIVHPLILRQRRGLYNGSFRLKVQVRDATGRVLLQREVEFVGPEVGLLQIEGEGRHARR